MRLLDDRGYLRTGDLRRLGIFERHGARAGRHDLDEVRAPANLLPHRLAHLVRAVGLAIHVREVRAARRGRGEDASACEYTRFCKRAELDGAPHVQKVVPEGADITKAGDPHAQHLPKSGRDEVVLDLRLDARLALERRGQVERGDVHVCVDKTGKQRPSGEVGDCRGLRRGVATRSDADDLAVLDEYRRALSRRGARSVDETRVREIQRSHRKPLSSKKLARTRSPAGCSALDSSG